MNELERSRFCSLSAIVLMGLPSLILPPMFYCGGARRRTIPSHSYSQRKRRKRLRQIHCPKARNRARGRKAA